MITIKIKAKPKDKVYAISRIYQDKEATSNLSIYEAIVDSVNISINPKTNKQEIDYWLKTPDGEDWGAEVSEEEIDKDFNKLIKKVKKEWISKSNTF